MKVSGEHTIAHPVEKVWDALLDPAVLVRTIPGCERLVATGEHSYAMTVTAGVAAIRGTYDGRCELSDLAPHQALVMRLQGAGAPGTIDATVNVAFAAAGDATTITYDADAVVGGMVGGVGQRMLGSVSKRMAAEFFDNVGGAIGAPPVAAVGVADADRAPDGAARQVFTAPPRQAAYGPDFRKGVALGAGLVLLGVAFGGLFGRRRR